MNQQTKPTWSAAARLAERLAVLYAEVTPEERQILEAILCPATVAAGPTSDEDTPPEAPASSTAYRRSALALAIR